MCCKAFAYPEAHNESKASAPEHGARSCQLRQACHATNQWSVRHIRDRTHLEEHSPGTRRTLMMLEQRAVHALEYVLPVSVSHTGRYSRVQMQGGGLWPRLDALPVACRGAACMRGAGGQRLWRCSNAWWRLACRSVAPDVAAMLCAGRRVCREDSRHHVNCPNQRSRLTARPVQTRAQQQQQ